MFRRRKNPFDLLNQLDSMFENYDSMMSPLYPVVKGEVKTESGSDENGNWTKQSFVSDDGTMSITSFIRTGQGLNRKDNDKLSSLKEKLEIAVDKQDFETAVNLRDEIKKLEKNKDEIKKLRLELDNLIEKQEFEKAIDVRDKLKKLE